MGKNSKNIDTDNRTNKLFSLFAVKNIHIEISFTTTDLLYQRGLLLMKEYEQQSGFI